MVGMPHLNYPTDVHVSDSVRLRLATPADVNLIVDWSQDSDVHTWWDGQPLTDDDVRAKYVNGRAPYVISYIVEEQHQPLGYIQAWQDGVDPARGLDMFLASHAQGRGLGPLVARALAQVLAAHGWTDITADPGSGNARAIRAWTKAGFLDSGRRGVDEGHDTILMTYEP